MELQIITPDNPERRTLSVSEVVFDREYNEALVHQVLNAYMAGARAGTKAQKNRAAVSGGGRKPWKQKGTGRARAGTSRSPLWRTGGKTFAAEPRDFSQKVNRKMYVAAMRSILSELVRQERLILVDSFTVDEPKTRLLLNRLQQLEIDNALLVNDDMTENLVLSARNLYHVQLCQPHQVSPANLIAYDRVLFTVGALKQIEEVLQ